MPKTVETIEVGSMTEAFDLNPRKNELLFSKVQDKEQTASLHLYSLETGEEREILRLASESIDFPAVHSLFFDGSGSGLFVQFQESTFYFNIESREQQSLADYRQRATLFNAHLMRNMISQNRDRLALADLGGIKVIDSGSREVLCQVPVEAAAYYRLFALSPSGKTLALYFKHQETNEFHLQLWDVDGCQKEGEFKVDPNERIFAQPQKLIFSPDGSNLLISGGFAEGPIMLEARTGKTLFEFAHPSRSDRRLDCFGMAFSHDSKTLAVGGYRSAITLIDFAQKQEIDTFYGENMRSYGLIFSANDQRLYSGGDGGVITVSDLSDLQNRA